MASMKMIAILAAAIIVVAAAAAVVVVNDGNDDDSFTIVDGSGNKVSFDGPVDNIATVGDNICEAVKILGFSDKIKGLSIYTSSEDNDKAFWDKYSPMFPNSTHLSKTKDMTGEELIEAGIKCVIAPTKSMTVKSDQEKSYNELGIKVVRLDCNGDETINDFKTIIKLLSGKETNEYLEDYLEMSNSVINTVKEKVRNENFDGKTFLAFFNSKNAFYNQTSVVSNNIEEIYGKNALRNIENLDLSGISNEAKTLAESLVKIDNEKNIDKLFFRFSKDAVKNYNDSDLVKNEILKNISPIKSCEVYMMHTDIMSGPLAYISYIAYAEFCGVDTGFDVSKLISEYNEKYGFSESSSGLFYKLQSDGTMKEIVIN